MSLLKTYLVYYGFGDTFINVTLILQEKCEAAADGVFAIPTSDIVRAEIFGDPVYGTRKHLVFVNKSNYIDTLTFFVNNQIYVRANESGIVFRVDTDWQASLATKSAPEKLQLIHSKLMLLGGTFDEEYDEQLMVATYLSPNAHVLELGSYIGRNTLIISSILSNSRNLVTLETNARTAQTLAVNRTLNGLSFRIENSALSKTPLIQSGLTCYFSTPETMAMKDAFPVKTITWDELQSKHSDLNFDTIVLDCEGAFANILHDFPEILQNIKLIIMENDYQTLEAKQQVDTILIENKFINVFSSAGGWGPCEPVFYQVWQKK